MEKYEPICKFESDKQFQAILKYWQQKLFLENWIIKGVLTPELIKLDDGTVLEGRNHVIPQSTTAFIEVSQDETDDDIVLEKHCEELTLVHELLHCKYAYLTNTNTSIESAHFEITEHAKLHEMARTLLMVKYNIGFDWFKNF